MRLKLFLISTKKLYKECHRKKIVNIFFHSKINYHYFFKIRQKHHNLSNNYQIINWGNKLCRAHLM